MEARSIRVLLIDDAEDDFVVIRKFLAEIEGAGYQLDWEETYEAGLEAVTRDEHDVYLVDYHLGERDGLDLIRDGLSLGWRAPLILLTGHGDHEVDIEAMKAGAADYLIKGAFDAALLERCIRYSVARSRVEQERAALEDQLRQTQKMEAIGKLAGGIAHDFNNLLTAILGYAQLGATMVAPSSRLESHFQEISKAAQRAADLTRGLLAFSRHQVTERRVLDLSPNPPKDGLGDSP